MGQYRLGWLHETQTRIPRIPKINSWHSWLRWWLLEEITRIRRRITSIGYNLKWTSKSASRIRGYLWTENDWDERTVYHGVRVGY